MLAVLVGPFAGAVSPAVASVGLGVSVAFPSAVTVGATGIPATLEIVNFSTPPDNSDPVTIDAVFPGVPAITLVPSCGTPFATDCSAPDVGVFAVSATGTGEAGTACGGMAFTTSLVDPATGEVSFAPSFGPVVLQPPGSPGDTCRVNFTIDVIRGPAIDSQPAQPGIQTSQIASATGLNTTTTTPGSGTGVSNVTVLDPAAGELRVTTSPPLPSQILLDGVPRDSYGLNWLKLGAGNYTLGFTHVEGWTEPAPQTVTVASGTVTTVDGIFARRAMLEVVTNPAVAGTISVDGVSRDDWGVFTDLPPGIHQVCFGPVAGFDPPGCQTVSLLAGVHAVVTGNYVGNAIGPGPTGVGFLRVASSPALPTQILVDGIPRDTWGLRWLKLAPGSYTVSFTHIEGWTEPAPSTVTVTDGVTTTVTGVFTPRGSLEVKTDPARPGTISVDGIPRDNWGMWTDLPVGSHDVCFGPVPGYIPACENATLSAGTKTTVVHTYLP